MKYIVYLTTNLVNNKIYIGVHKTKDPDIFDGYLGDGVMINAPRSYKRHQTPFLCAVDKYGVKNFHRKILRVFDSVEDALRLEQELVSPSFIERTDTYNITLGGGMPPDPSKPIYQYELNGKFIKKWDAIKQITDYYQVNKDQIRMVINDKRSFNGNYWSEEFFEILDIKEYRPSSRGSIRLYTTDGVYLKSFKNTTEAARALDIDRRKITNAIYHKCSTSGYWFLKELETIEMYLNKFFPNEVIYQYGLDGTLIKEFLDFKSLKKDIKINKGDLKRAAKNNSLLANYYWSFNKYNNILEENPEILKNTPRKVYLYDKEGNFIKEWNSINECKKEYVSVLQVCLGNREHCKGFKFSFDKPKILSDTISNNG